MISQLPKSVIGNKLLLPTSPEQIWKDISILKHCFQPQLFNRWLWHHTTRKIKILYSALSLTCVTCLPE